MTSLLLSRTTTGAPDPGQGPRRPSAEVLRDLLAARPLTAMTALGGVAAALGPLLVAMTLGLVGWYLTDGGTRGTPTGGLRVGAVAWLLGHGSGLGVDGVAVTAVPLGATLLCGYVVHRVARRVGAGISGHGPGAEALADGARDWTVPVALVLFTGGYAVVGGLAAALASGGAAVGLSGPRVLLGCVLLCLVVAGPTLAVASGRAAVWVGAVPPLLLTSARVARRTLVAWLLVSAVTLVAALAADLATAANVFADLHTDAGAAALVVLLTLLAVPNALGFSSAYVLGPGFTVGAGTLVTPASATLGPLPTFPLLAALPDDGPAPAWTTALLVLAPLVALLATVTVQRRVPTTSYADGALRGLVGGVGAGLVVGALSWLCGGAVGPGRLAEVGPLVGQVTAHAVATFAAGGVLGALLLTWWQRRDLAEVEEQDEAADPAEADDGATAP